MNHEYNEHTWMGVALFAIILVILASAFGSSGCTRAVGAAQPVDDEWGGGPQWSEIGWAGTGESSADEWYELFNPYDTPLSTEGYEIRTVRVGGSVYTSTIPVVTIEPGDVALFERTDDNAIPEVAADGIHGSGMSLVGIFPNTDIVSIEIVNTANPTVEYHKLVFADGEWAAGSNSPHASMAWVSGPAEWVTSNQSVSAVTYGSPGLVNTGNVAEPDTCDSIPANWIVEMQMVDAGDGLAFHPQVSVTAELLGLEDGEFTEVTAIAYWNFTKSQPEWTFGADSYSGTATNDCIDAFEMVRDAVDTVLTTGNVPAFFPSENIGSWERNISYTLDVYHFINEAVFQAFMPQVVNE
jgi:hypothetical protein